MKIKVRRIFLYMMVLLFVSTSVPVYAEDGDSDVSQIRVCAVGDNLIHSRVYKSGMNEDGTRDYSDMYRFYDRYLDGYDICVVNQETVFVEDEKNFSGYPTFGGPKEIGNALIDAGFNVVTTATNHIMDKGIDAVWYSHRFWTNWGIEPVGTYVYEEWYDADTGETTNNRAIFITRNNIRIGMLNYTYGTNGIKIPDDYKWMIGTLDDKELIKREVQWADKRCDVLIVFPHWGIEYQYKPSKSQKEWAQFFADNGADVIIGTHPHVVEPLEYIESSSGKKVPCYYSLGNFISNQSEVPRMLGAAATFTIVKDGDNVEIKDVSAVPTVTHITSYSEKFYAKCLFDYTAEEESSHRLRRIKGSEFSIDNLWKLWYNVFTEEQTGNFIAERISWY